MLDKERCLFLVAGIFFLFFLDAKTVLALFFFFLNGVIRADRFCEGALLSFMKSGAIQRELVRLKELDL